LQLHKVIRFPGLHALWGTPLKSQPPAIKPVRSMPSSRLLPVGKAAIGWIPRRPILWPCPITLRRTFSVKDRISFRAGVCTLNVHNRGKWSMELSGAVWLYTDNNDFFNGNKLEQDPYYAIQSHLIYTFHPGVWASASAGYGYGGKSTINGVEKNDSRGNLSWA